MLIDVRKFPNSFDGVPYSFSPIIINECLQVTKRFWKGFTSAPPFRKEGRRWFVKIVWHTMHFIIDYSLILQTTPAPPLHKPSCARANESKLSCLSLALSLEKEGTMRFEFGNCWHSYCNLDASIIKSLFKFCSGQFCELFSRMFFWFYEEDSGLSDK